MRLQLESSNFDDSHLGLKSSPEAMEISTSFNLAVEAGVVENLLTTIHEDMPQRSFGEQPIADDTTAEDEGASHRTASLGAPNWETTGEEGDSSIPPLIHVSIGEETRSGKKKVICSDDPVASASRADSPPVEENDKDSSFTSVYVSYVESPGRFWYVNKQTIYSLVREC